MKHYSLSKYEDFNEIDLFIWPETALTYTSINEILNKDSIYDLLRNDAMLITGMPRIIFNEYNPEKFKLYN